MSETNSTNNSNPAQKTGLAKLIGEPLSKHGWPKWLVYLISAFSLVYILNPTLGVFELIPDNLPLVGNMDEGVATMLVLSGIVEALDGRRRRQADKAEIHT
jgi:uncharacterized membrane protein YkvA (DUF1232 family)